MTINRIWIPSLQKFIKMKEMSCEDRRIILKSIEDDSDFDFSLEEFIKNNIQEKDLSSEKFTILDRFVIILQSRVYSCGDKLHLNRVCEKCDTKTDFSIDLNNLLDNMSVVDKSFENNIKDVTRKYAITYDWPNSREYLWSYRDKTKESTSYIKTLWYEDKIVKDFSNIKDIDYDKKQTVCDKIPMFLISDLGKQINDLKNIVNKISIAKLVCKNEKCKDELSLNMDIDNLLDLTKLLFKDSSLQSILGQYANVSMNCHFDYNFYKNLSPIELDIVSNMLKTESSSGPPVEENPEKDFFQEYRLQTQGMVESPSEF